MKRVWALWILLSGCSTKYYGSNGVPEMPAGVSYTRWEHYCAHIRGDIRLLDDVLEEAGSQGWELAAITGNLFCFRRPTPSR